MNNYESLQLKENLLRKAGLIRQSKKYLLSKFTCSFALS
jgi:hypothetical protein